MKNIDFEHVALEVGPFPDRFGVRSKLDQLGISGWAVRFVESKAVLLEATDAILAKRAAKVIGLLLYSVERRGRGAEMCSHGTYVERQFRRQGIGLELWNRALYEVENRSDYGTVRGVRVTTVTRDGAGFVSSGLKALPVTVWHDRCG